LRLRRRRQPDQRNPAQRPARELPVTSAEVKTMTDRASATLWTLLCAMLLVSWHWPAAAQTNPSPYTSASRYDAQGHLTGMISADPDGVGSGNPFLAVRNSYDGAGRL